MFSRALRVQARPLFHSYLTLCRDPCQGRKAEQVPREGKKKSAKCGIYFTRKPEQCRCSFAVGDAGERGVVLSACGPCLQG